MKESPISIERQEWNKEPDVAALEQAASLLDFSEAETAFKNLIGRGSVLSMVNLGSRYESQSRAEGSRDFTQAEYWYRKAIDAGSAAATLPVGYFYLRQKDYKKACEIFSIGRERGYAPSIVRLGDLYVKGQGVECDYAVAKSLFSQAADLGNLWGKSGAAAMTMSLARSRSEKYKGSLMLIIALLQIKYQKWREPRSEKLKK